MDWEKFNSGLAALLAGLGIWLFASKLPFSEFLGPVGFFVAFIGLMTALWGYFAYG